MYAYVDGESSVSAGVCFFYMLSQELRQIRVSVLGGLPEDFHNLLRIHLNGIDDIPLIDDILIQKSVDILSAMCYSSTADRLSNHFILIPIKKLPVEAF